MNPEISPEEKDLCEFLQSDNEDDTCLLHSGSTRWALTAESSDDAFIGYYAGLFLEPDNISSVAFAAPSGSNLLCTAPSCTISSGNSCMSETTEAPVNQATHAFSSAAAVDAKPLPPSNSSSSSTVGQYTQQDLETFQSRCVAYALALASTLIASLRLPGRKRAASGARIQKLGPQAAYRVIVRYVSLELSGFYTMMLHPQQRFAGRHLFSDFHTVHSERLANRSDLGAAGFASLNEAPAPRSGKNSNEQHPAGHQSTHTCCCAQ